MQERMDDERKREIANDKNRYFSEREKELSHYREIIEKQESELNAYRTRLKEELYLREKELRKELEERERYFLDREKKLVERQKEFEEHFHRRELEAESLRNHLQKEISSREYELKKAFDDLALEKERLTKESREKIEQTSQNYVEDALELLSTKESQFHTMSKIWSGVGASCLVVGVIFFVIVTFRYGTLDVDQVTWQFLIFTLFKGLVTVGLLATIAKYAYLFSSSYMHESLKNADRRHAINFGKFYLQSYGAAADWSEVKEAFEHWNISGSNAFTRQEPSSSDENTLEKAVQAIQKSEKCISDIKEKIKV
ncbi:hypothetical protein [Aeromonas salmonicida]|uniref:hypothetical protein n=1 Tax=Aeromonas salmonicida TaxID=645 RepID=UPI000DE5A802|nr:hypothetical protein [Aeromonas salmonicida]